MKLFLPLFSTFAAAFQEFEDFSKDFSDNFLVFPFLPSF